MSKGRILLLFAAATFGTGLVLVVYGTTYDPGLHCLCGPWVGLIPNYTWNHVGEFLIMLSGLLGVGVVAVESVRTRNRGTIDSQ